MTILKRPEEKKEVCDCCHLYHYGSNEMDSFLSQIADYAETEIKDSEHVFEYEDYRTLLERIILILKGESTVRIITDEQAKQLAEKLKEARRLRERANKIIYVHDSPLFDDDVRHLEELADAIEEEVIRELRGE